jgi:hypothetical protein
MTESASRTAPSPSSPRAVDPSRISGDTGAGVRGADAAAAGALVLGASSAEEDTVATGDRASVAVADGQCGGAVRRRRCDDDGKAAAARGSRARAGMARGLR